MENDLRWLPTKEASAFLGVSSQFLKKNRDIKDGFLLEEKHYILGANINSSILWNVSEILKEFHYSCLLYTSPSPRDLVISRMPSSA